jgi:hypothetical protein
MALRRARWVLLGLPLGRRRVHGVHDIVKHALEELRLRSGSPGRSVSTLSWPDRSPYATERHVVTPLGDGRFAVEVNRRPDKLGNQPVARAQAAL